MSIIHRYEFPDRFVAGTVGDPGERVFYVQARLDSRLTSVVVEKQQVQVLADHLSRILDELTRLSDGALNIPPARNVARDLDPLDMPLEEEFRVGTMTIAWDATLSAVQVELFRLDETESEDAPFEVTSTGLTSGEALEVKITPDQARDFVARSSSLVKAGRPACPFCGQPVESDGHICPRANGYRRALFS